MPATWSAQRLCLMVTLIAFSVLTTAALWYHGYWGILEPHFRSFGEAQVLADLVIALSLFMVWVWHDAKATGRNPWPWLVLTLVAGSFSPIIYLLGQRQSELAKPESQP